MKNRLKERFIKYAKINTRSNPDSTTIPSTSSQVEFAQELVKELEGLGLSQVAYSEASGFVTACLEANTEKDLPTIGFIAHMDTADFNAENIKPQVFENYDGSSDIVLDNKGEYVLSPKQFPNLRNYKGHTLITTDGTTLLGADDKAGIAEIITTVEYLLKNPDIKHGRIKLAFGPDEEIGTGSNNFDVEAFGADFAYTLDGGPLGELQFENFNAASATVRFKGTNVHTGTAKGKLVNSILLAMDFQNSLPEKDRPENTEMYEGFFFLESFKGKAEETTLEYLIREHDKNKFEARKKSMEYIVTKMNEELGQERVSIEIKDSYYNMLEIMKDNMEVVDLAKRAMLRLDIEPNTDPIRGGTDGARFTYMGLPTPNIFAGGENMHGRYEFVSLETMEKAMRVILEIIKLNVNPL